MHYPTKKITGLSLILISALLPHVAIANSSQLLPPTQFNSATRCNFAGGSTLPQLLFYNGSAVDANTLTPNESAINCTDSMSIDPNNGDLRIKGTLFPDNGINIKGHIFLSDTSANSNPGLNINNHVFLGDDGGLGHNAGLNINNRVFLSDDGNGKVAGLNIKNGAILNVNGLSIMSLDGSGNPTATAGGWLSSNGELGLAKGHLWVDAAGQANFSDNGSTVNAWINSAGKAYFADSVTCAGGCITPSDMRLKTDIHQMSDGMQTIMALKPVSYLWKNSDKNENLPAETYHHGFLAQDVQQVMPDIVHEISVPEQVEQHTLGVDYSGIIAPLVKAVQEQQAEIVAQRKEIDALKEELHNR